jgi:hypothetical protein
MRNQSDKEKLLEKFTDFLTKTNDEELLLTKQILNGLQQKQQNQYLTYLDALCNSPLPHKH